MQDPLPRRSKGPSAIAAASAGVAGPGSGSEDDSGPGPEPTATAAPISAVAAAFVAELTVTPPDQAAAGTAKAALRAPAGRRLPRAALLVGAAVVGAALMGGAFLVAGAGDGDRRPSASGTVTHATRSGGPDESTPSLLGSAPPSTSPSADVQSASPRSPATGSPTDGGTRSAAQAKPSATLFAVAAGADHAHTRSGGSDHRTSCTPTAGSGTITVHSACASSGTVTFQATFNTSQSFYHVFINTDGNTATGYQLPYPSPSALGADYMIENGGLYESRSTGWKWTEVATSPTMKVSGPTRTWTLPLSGIGSPTGTQKVEFNAGSDYTPVITFSSK